MTQTFKEKLEDILSKMRHRPQSLEEADRNIEEAVKAIVSAVEEIIINNRIDIKKEPQETWLSWNAALDTIVDRLQE